MTLKMYRIDTGKYIDRFTLLVMANRKIFITFLVSLSSGSAAHVLVRFPFLSYDVRDAKAVHDMNVCFFYRSHRQVKAVKKDVIRSPRFCTLTSLRLSSSQTSCVDLAKHSDS